MTKSSNPKPGVADNPKRQGFLSAWWPLAKTGAKAITGLSGLVAAIVAIYAWFPLARDTVWPELKEYETLASLYAGASVSFFDEKLGSPSIVKALPEDTAVTERLYVKKDYIVETLATPDGQTRLYSVLSCAPNFKPSFDFFHLRITLQDQPLAKQMPFGSEPSELYYEIPRTVSSPTFYFELVTETSGHSLNRGSGYGVNSVNGACGVLPTTNYQGPVAEAPQDINDYRSKTPPNFYVETWDRQLRGSADKAPIPFLKVTPFHEDVPPGWPKS